ncbi:hypothetical protein AGMMS49975_06830 [Clostridia bacterium]|nr:hypothetical protein AGMMS49975_06830 [Clostridia bacterium]
METKIVIDDGEKSARVAYLEDGVLRELIVEDKVNVSIIGNIYLGVVKNMLPTHFAFIDIGLEKQAFLQVDQKVKRGSYILVQALKDPVGTKGAYLTEEISFTSLHAVLLVPKKYTPLAVSKKIEGKRERERLKQIYQKYLPEGYSAVIRTNSAHKDEAFIETEIGRLVSQAREVVKSAQTETAPKLIRAENSPLARAIARVSGIPADEYIINTPFRDYTFFDNEVNIFRYFGIEEQIREGLNKKVWLKCGGCIIIEQTEACVVVDVNSGKCTRGNGRGEIIRKINLEAAAEIACQLRLRNLSGIIIVDFINPEEKEQNEELRAYLSECLSKDRFSAEVISVTDVGIFILTRKKSGDSLERLLTESCGHCGGSGKILRI